MKKRYDKSEATVVVLQAESKSLQTQLRNLTSHSDSSAGYKNPRDLAVSVKFQQQLDKLDTENSQLRTQLVNLHAQGF